MARPLRIEFEGALYHITTRGNEKKAFYRNGEDCNLFLDILASVNRRYHWTCHAYCLMRNHYHLIIETPEGNLSEGMRQLNGVYTQTFNKKCHRVGHIFQGRYKAILIQKESHLLEACRYIVLNPVRAKRVMLPEKWKWGSYRATAGLEEPHGCLSVDWILSQFGSNERTMRKRYREFVHDGISAGPIWAELKGQILLGDSSFIEKFGKYLKGHETIREIPKSQRYMGRPSLDDLLDKNLLSSRPIRNKRICDAVEKHGYSQRSVADYLGMHYSTVSRLIKHYE